MTAALFGTPAHVLLFSVRAFLYALAALVSYRLVLGTISARGLLRDRTTGATSAVRLQMLIATAIASASYAAAIRQQTTGVFPPVDTRLLALIGGSNGLVIIQRALNKLKGARQV